MMVTGSVGHFGAGTSVASGAATLSVAAAGAAGSAAALGCAAHPVTVPRSMTKDYKLFTCPTCKTTLRVPKGKGRINLTCPKCQTKFAGKS